VISTIVIPKSMHAPQYEQSSQGTDRSAVPDVLQCGFGVGPINTRCRELMARIRRSRLLLTNQIKSFHPLLPPAPLFRIWS